MGSESTSATAVMAAYSDVPPEAQKAALVVITGRHMGEVHAFDKDVMILGRHDGCDIVLQDDGISREHCIFRRERDALFIEDLESTNGTWIDRTKIVRRRLVSGDRIRLGLKTTIRFMLQDEEDEAYHRDLYEAAVRDGLTGAYNKRYFTDRLEGELTFARRHGEPLSLILFDVDHFKTINDTHGHPVGDAVLTQLTKMIHEISRTEDVLARFGGDEFAIIARGLSAQQVHAFAERLRVNAQETHFGAGAETLRVTLSIGTATTTDAPVSGLAFIEQADQALYAAKREGRNRVSPPAPPATAAEARRRNSELRATAPLRHVALTRGQRLGER